jgi:hypothetical protein
MKMNVNKEYGLGSGREKGDKERFLSSFFQINGSPRPSKYALCSSRNWFASELAPVTLLRKQ